MTKIRRKKEEEKSRGDFTPLWEVGVKRPLNRVNKWKKNVKNFFCLKNFTPLLNKKVQIWDHFFPLLFPNDSKYLKFLDIGLQEVGGKKTSKRSKQMTKIHKTVFFCHGNFAPIFEQKISNLTPFLSINCPQGFWITKKFGHWTLWNGGKKTITRIEQSVMDRQTHKTKTNKKWQNPS